MRAARLTRAAYSMSKPKTLADAIRASFLENPLTQGDVERSADMLQDVCHGLSVASGWWHDPKTGEPINPRQPHLVPAKLCLIHSEISEAMEGDRKNLDDDKLPHRKMLEVELADAAIRIFDLAGALDLDLPGAIVEKLRFNQQRADHKPENRAAEGGKAY